MTGTPGHRITVKKDKATLSREEMGRGFSFKQSGTGSACMSLCCYLNHDNAMAPTITSTFLACLLMSLLRQNHSPLIFTSFLSAVSCCTEHRSFDTIQMAIMMLISMSWH